jgi:NACHT domain-containing protein
MSHPSARRRRQRHRHRGLIVSGIAVAWTAGMLVLVVWLLRTGGDRAVYWATVLGTITALAGVTIPLVERALTRVSPGPVAAGIDLLVAAGQLGDAVRGQWEEEASQRRLQDPWPLPLSWEAGAEDLTDGTYGPDPGVRLAGDLPQVVALFQRLPHRRLTILGPPGSGKTVVAIRLTLELLRAGTPGAPVPVLFPLSAWDPSRAELDDWLIDYLVGSYQLAGVSDVPAAMRGLLDRDLLLPILDGLDEVPPALHAAAIRGINRRLRENQPVVLTCRTREYRAAVQAGTAVTLAAAVELRPLRLETAIGYLRDTTPGGERRQRWEPVFERLRTDPGGALATALRTPLMVTLARAIYADTPRDPRELLERRFEELTALEDHLLAELLPAAYQELPPHPDQRPVPWRATEARTWLAHLAGAGVGPGRTHLAWWKLEDSVRDGLIGAIGAVLGGMVVALAFGTATGLLFTLAVVVLTGWAGPRTLESLLAGRVERWVGRLPRVLRPVAGAVLGLGERVPIARRAALAAGRTVGFLAGSAQVLIGYDGDIYRAVADGLAVGLSVGLAVSFLTVAPRTAPSEVKFDVRRGVGVFARHLALGLVIGAGAGVAGGAVLGSGFGVLVGVVMGVSFGVVDGLSVWLDVSTDVTRALSPRSTRRAERIAAIARSVTVAVTIGAAVGLAYGIGYGLRSAVWHGLAYGLGFGLADRYMGLMPSVWGRYLIAKGWLALTGRIPWRLMAFLDDAHSRDVLRRFGAAYQFRHARLRDHLAR